MDAGKGNLAYDANETSSFFMVFTGHLEDSGTANIFASDSFSASERPPWWFFVAGNEPGNSFLLVEELWGHWAWQVSCLADFLYHVFRSICQGRTMLLFEAVLDLWSPPDQVHRFGRASQLAVSRWPGFLCTTPLILPDVLSSLTNASNICLLQWKQGRQR